MKEYYLVYRIKSKCRKCPPDEFEQFVQEYDDRLLTYEIGKPIIYSSWVDLLDSIPTNDVEIKEAKWNIKEKY